LATESRIDEEIAARMPNEDGHDGRVAPFEQ
jgi:hypothetical protein